MSTRRSQKASAPCRGVIYGRQSKTKVGSESLETQVAACRAAAEQYGVEVAAVILEPPSTSAYKNRGRERPRFPELLELIQTGSANVVIGYKTDRFSRGGGPGWAPLLDAAENADVDLDRLVLIPGSGFMSEFEIGIRATMDREESKKTSERLRDMKERHAADGRPSGGGNRPFGYGVDRRTPLEPGASVVLEGEHVAEAAILRDACEAYLAGEPIDSICRRWNESGVRTPTGGEWRGQTLRNVLRSPRIAGLRTHQGDIVGEAAWPPIVDRDTWERVQAKFRANAGRAPTAARTHLLTGGLVCCAKCGHPMSTAPVFGVGKYRCEKRPGKPNCGGMTVSIDPVDELVIAMVLFRLDSPAMATALKRDGRREADRSAGADVANGEAKLEELAATWATGEITRAEWMTARKAIETRIAAARSRLDRDDRRAAVIGLAAAGLSLSVRWTELPLGRQRAVIAAIVDRVMIRPAAKPGSRYFDPDRVEVIWRV